ncbi:MAG: membrane protein insertion efficiency factor YidD [Planctomycetota bacterium]
MTEPQRSPLAPLNLPLIGLVRLYQVTLGQLVGGRCRFYPSCSNYALEAMRTHNPLRACWLTIRRLARCHPLGGHGVDPVPPFQRDESTQEGDETQHSDSRLTES